MRFPWAIGASVGFRRLWIGQSISFLGDNLVNPVGVSFAVFQIGGSVSQLGAVLGATSAARVLLLIVGGVWADRLGRRRVMLAADSIRGVTQAFLAVALFTGTATIPELLVASTVAGAAGAFFMPASTAIVADVVQDERLLQPSNAALGLARSTAQIAGPAAAGVVVASVGLGWLYAADALSFLTSVSFLARIPATPMSPRPVSSFRRDLAEGWRELVVRPWYWLNLVAHGCWNFGFTAFLVLGPLVARESLGGARAWGAIAAAFGVGAVAGGMLALRWQPQHPLVVGNLALVTATIPLGLLAARTSAWAIAAGAAVAGCGLILLVETWSATIQRMIPREVLSRVAAYDWTISIAANPLGFALFGTLAERVGVKAALVVASLAVGVPSAAVVLLPGVRSIRAPARQEEAAEPAA
jgi:MFS family permease